jgi:hypothetical protein
MRFKRLVLVALPALVRQLHATTTRLESYEQVPTHENLAPAPRRAPHCQRRITGPRRPSRPRRRLSLGQAMALTWLATSIALIIVALALSHTAQPHPHATGSLPMLGSAAPDDYSRLPVTISHGPFRDVSHALGHRQTLQDGSWVYPRAR